jgi:hypothetical protein
MIIRLNAALRRRPGHRERGAATLEAVGMYAVAAMIAAGVALAALGSSPVVRDKFRQAVCMLSTLGQGECGSSVTSAADHKPAEPCVVSAEGHNGAVEASFIVTVGASEQFLVEKLNNGKSRVTRGTGGKVGVGVGAGFNVTTTWDDKTYGAAAKADASVAALFSGGEVYYADNDDEVRDLMTAHTEDVAEDTVFGGSGPVRWLVDGAEDLVGLGNDFPPSDEVYIEGDIHLDASAQVTFLMADAQAGLGVSAMLGIRQGADDTSTTYYKASLDGNISAGSWAGDEQTGQTIYAKVGLEGAAEGIIEVERDSLGNITAVRVKSVLSGTAEASETGGTVSDGPGERKAYSEKMVELPIRTATDQAIAQRYLNALGMGPLGGFTDIPAGVQNYLPIQNPLDALGATKEFAQAASLRGFVTEQTFDNSPSSYGLNFDAEAIAKVGGGATVETVNRRSTGAWYFDGQKMVTWKGCGEK